MLPTQFVVLFSTNKKISVLDQVDITMILMAHYSLFLAFNYGDRIFFFFFWHFVLGAADTVFIETHPLLLEQIYPFLDGQVAW